jgi:hypothetical protein
VLVLVDQVLHDTWWVAHSRAIAGDRRPAARKRTGCPGRMLSGSRRAPLPRRSTLPPTSGLLPWRSFKVRVLLPAGQAEGERAPPGALPTFPPVGHARTSRALPPTARGSALGVEGGRRRTVPRGPRARRTRLDAPPRGPGSRRMHFEPDPRGPRPERTRLALNPRGSRPRRMHLSPGPRGSRSRRTRLRPIPRGSRSRRTRLALNSRGARPTRTRLALNPRGASPRRMRHGSKPQVRVPRRYRAPPSVPPD